VSDSPEANTAEPETGSEEQEIGELPIDAEPETTGAERDAYRDALQRVQADFENYRKRILKQQGEASERANEALVQKLLPVLDTVDLAKAHDPNGAIEQVSAALLDVLHKEGLERVVSVNEPFDPNQHEAVAMEKNESETEGGARVSEELRAGYRWKGRVLRPAMVKVVG